MKYISILVSILLLTRLCSNNQQVPQPVPVEPLPEEHLAAREVVEEDVVIEETEDELYYKATSSEKIAWNDSTLIFHYWKNIKDAEYMFSVPNPDSVSRWKVICETENLHEGYNWLPDRYKTMNQYITVGDMGIRCGERGSFVRNKDFILWRLEQFRTDTLRPVSLSDKFSLLDTTIKELLDYQPFFTFEYNNWAGLKNRFQEFYDEILFNETLKQTDKTIARALKQEKRAWENYHQALDSTIFVLISDPEGLMGNTYSRTIDGLLAQDAFVWKKALESFSYPLSGLSDPERHALMPESKVLKEYQHFMNSLEEKEYLLPVPDRQKSLKYEMSYWRKWMNSRNTVSSLLSGKAKEYYDNATNNVRRMKYIMLKNCYEGFGVTSQTVLGLLIPFTASDEELEGLNFIEKWKLL